MTNLLHSDSEIETSHEPVPPVEVSPGKTAELKHKSWAKVVFSALFALIVILPVIEMFLSISHIGEQEYLKIDPLVGFMHLENKLVTDRTEATALSQINSRGLNDIEHELVKEAGTTRVAVLGDSLVEALQVTVEKRFTGLLQQNLNSSMPGKKKFEVINFGTGGYSTGQEYLQYIRDVRPYKPDLVVLVVHQGDEEENAPVSDKWSLRPTFALSPYGSPEVRWQEFDTWRESRSADPLIFFDWGRRHSHLWQALLQIHDSLKNDDLFKRLYNYATTYCGYAKSAFLSASPSLRKGLNEKESSTRAQVQNERAALCREASLLEESGSQQPLYDGSLQWRLQFRLLALFNSKCKADGCKFVVATVPAVEKSKESRYLFARRLESMKTVAAQFGFGMIDISPLIDQTPDQKTDPLFLLAHFSPRGHQLIAKKLADFIEQEVH